MSSRRGFVLTAAVLLAFGLAMPAAAVPQWARRCHAWPGEQLTATGLDFLRRGHRLKGDGFDKDLTHLISGHVEWEYDVAQGATNQFNNPEFHFHAGGALAENFSGYLDVNVNNDIEAGYLQYTKESGDDTYFTLRGGKFNPTIIRNYVGGLTVSASSPLVFAGTPLGNNPFNPSDSRLGVDASARVKSIFVQGGVVNGEDVPGQATVGHHKDFYGTAEVTAPDGISGVGLYYYHGAYDLGDPTAGALLDDRYYRAAAFANFTRDNFRLVGAYLYGKDEVQTLASGKVHGFYAQAELRPGGWWLPFVRYDDATTELDTGKDHVRQGTVGVALQIYMTESTSGRVVIEGARSSDPNTHTNTNSGLVNVVWAF